MSRLNTTEKKHLRQYLVRRFNLNDLKNLAFDISVDFELFAYEEKGAFARELISFCERRNKLNLLITEAISQRPDDSFIHILAKLPPLTKHNIKVQIVLDGNTLDDVSLFLRNLAITLNCEHEEIVLISAASGSIYLLLNLPEKLALRLLNLQTHNLMIGKYQVISIYNLDSLNANSKEAWRRVTCNLFPIKQGNKLRLIASWKDETGKNNRKFPSDTLTVSLHPDEKINSIKDDVSTKELKHSDKETQPLNLLNHSANQLESNNAQRTIGRYEIIKELGHGGMAKVYLARDPNFDRLVALKVIDHRFSRDIKFRDRFRNEARIIAQLEHRAIVPVYDTGEDNDELFLVMRYMPGDSLFKQLNKNPIVPLSNAILILNRLAAALSSAHKQNIIHRDIKPENVLLDDEGSTFLADFGIAHIDLESETLREANENTDFHYYIGSPLYMAPEQWVENGQIGPHTDIYQLGVMLFELLTGKRPFPNSTLGVLKDHHLNTSPPAATSINNNLPSICDIVLAKAMSKNPLERYKSPQTMAEELAKALNPETVKNRYQLTEELSKGHLVTEYLAHDIFEEEEVVLKRLKYALLPNQTKQQSYHNLSQILTTYQHQNVVPVHYMGVDRGKPYLITPFINNRSLGDLLQRGGALPIEEVCNIAQQIAMAIDNIHDHELTHGNIQPKKILLGEERIPLLIDLGLTQIAESTSAISQEAYIGSMPYMAPEQWLGKPESQKTDIYQFGITLFELLTAQKPFHGPSLSQYSEQHQKLQPPNASELNPTLPPSFDNILATAMSKIPNNRYKSAMGFVSTLINAKNQYQVDSLTDHVRTSMQKRNWDKAIASCEKILTIQLDNIYAVSQLKIAKSHQRKIDIYGRGYRARNEERWRDAAYYFERIPDYRDSNDMLAEAYQNLHQRGQLSTYKYLSQKKIFASGIRIFRKWGWSIVLIVGFILFVIFVIIKLSIPEASTPIVNSTSIPTQTSLPLSVNEAEHCLRQSEIQIKNSQNDEIIASTKESEQRLRLKNEEIIFNAETNFPSACKEIENYICLTWESEMGQIDDTRTCNITATYYPPNRGFDFVSLNGSLLDPFSTSEYKWKTIIPIDITE